MTDIDDKFSDYKPFLQGPEEHRHFLAHQGEFFCVRKTCDGCDLRDACDFVESEIPVNPKPSPRRGMGMDPLPFLLLKPKGSLDDVFDFCENVLGFKQPRESFNPSNHHFMLQEPGAPGLFIGKGQFRYYGTGQSFRESNLSDHFDVATEYSPDKRIVSMDFSSIEPRVATVASREPLWIRDFSGTEKAIYREIEWDYDFDFPSHVDMFQGKKYCWLVDMSSSFDEQCSGCSLIKHCTTVKDYMHSVPTDWHGTNTDSLFTDYEPGTLKGNEQRKKGKAVGLSLLYGGTSYTISRTLSSTESEAQKAIDMFFSKLRVLSEYMKSCKTDLFKKGYIANLFGRVRLMGDFLNSEDAKKRAYAARTSLNHPIQSSAADLLKLAQIRTDSFVREQGISPFDSLRPAPARIDTSEFHRQLKMAQVSSVHDESVIIVDDSSFLTHVPRLYKVMQLKDIMDALKADFTLELDIEYDDYRSWTATKELSTSLVNLLASLNGSKEDEEVPDTVYIDSKNLTKPLLEGLALLSGSSPSVGVVLGLDGGRRMVLDRRVAWGDFVELKIPFTT